MSDKRASGISDGELVLRLISGEQEYFRIFIERFGLLVFETVSRHVPEDIAEDIVQEVFIKVFKSLKSLDDCGKIAGWLRKISINCCCDYWRIEYKKKEISFSSLGGEYGNLFDKLESESAGEEFERKNRHMNLKLILDAALMYISPKDRIILEMVYFDGVSVEDAAKLMGMTKTGVKVRNFRARKKLLTILNKMGFKDSMYE